MKKLLLLLMMAISLVVIGLPLALNYSGLCFSKREWLSDEEKIRLAIQRVNIQSTVRIDVTHEENKELTHPKYLPYKSIDDFIAKNPNCCAIGPDKNYDYWPSTFIQRIFGNYADVITIKYLANYLNEDGITRSQTVVVQPVITNCGHVFVGTPH